MSAPNPLLARVNGKGSYWLPIFLDFLAAIKITSKEMAAPAPMEPYAAQLRALEQICDGLDAGVHHFVCLKARQLGISTLMLALDIFWLYMFPGLQGALIADTSDNKDAFRQIITTMLESLPKGMRIPIKKHNRSGLLLANGSWLQYISAGKRKNSGLGRSRALNFVHACVPGDTPVIVSDGRIKPIKDVRVGDEVLTHTGVKTRVVDAWSNDNDKGDLIRITPWLGQPLSFTSEHHIPTARGVIDAKDVRDDDWLVMPIRPITHSTTFVELPTTPPRPQGAGAISVGSGARVELTEEFGFACGYYLAEGTILRSPRGEPSGISFARHRTERHYADRAIGALSGLYSSRRTIDRKDSLTSVEYIYGASLSRWIVGVFGCLDGKMIPDVVFQWGESFCKGLLAGLLCGDGSKTASDAGTSKNRSLCERISRHGKRLGRPRVGLTDPNKRYPINRVSLTTTRSSIAMQARDIAASLGVGWASVSTKQAGIRFGRNCKETWTVAWASDAAASLRSLMGLDSVPCGDRAWVKKYRIEGGQVFLRIRRIERGIKCNTIYDITVEHEDHTFRTPYMAIGNSECSSWGDQKGLDSLLAALAEENPNRLYVFESTALGYNLFFDMCNKAKANPLAERMFFIGWWAKEIYRHPIGSEKYEQFYLKSPALSEYERKTGELVLAKYGHAITSEQWSWYREQASNKADASLKEEFPSHEEEAFQATGRAFFPSQTLAADVAYITTTGAVVPRKYNVALGPTFTTLEITEAVSDADAALLVWEDPNDRGKYVIGVDPATGEAEDPDNTVISIWRCYADKLVQVAEYATPNPTTQQCAWVMAYLAACYRDSLINLEVTGPGSAVMSEIKHLKQLIQYGHMSEFVRQIGRATAFDGIRWFLYHRVDSLGGNYAYNFRTTLQTKAPLLNKMRDAYNTSKMIARSVPLLREMSTITQVGAKIKGSGRNKDDRVMSAGLANWAWAEWVQPGMLAEKRTFDAEMAAENALKVVKGAGGQAVGQNIIQDFFKTKAVERQEAARQRLAEINY